MIIKIHSNEKKKVNCYLTFEDVAGIERSRK